MTHLSTFRLAVLLGLLAILLNAPARAQTTAPPWVLAKINPTASTNGTSTIKAMATDANGNVFVTGIFRQLVTFGTTTLTTRGGFDVFVAKYDLASDRWMWAVSLGGTNDDDGVGIAVANGAVYLTGTLINDQANSRGVQFDLTSNGPGFATQLGANALYGYDLFVAKYLDNGSSATLAWTQIGGGFYSDLGSGIAVSGTSVYVSGSITNTASNAHNVVFGGSGTTPGTWVQAGATATLSQDAVLVKYQDNGTSATVAWTQVAGGTDEDAAQAVAVSGTSVYVAGTSVNTSTNTNAVVFGGARLTAGTIAQAGATATASYDVFVAKYLDAGASATVAWTQVAGGQGDDLVSALAVSGSSVYVGGLLFNNRTNTAGVVFGGAGLVAGILPQYGASATSSYDAFVAKYRDNGTSATVGWTQVAGGTNYDYTTGLAVRGNEVYAALALVGSQANTTSVLLGGSGSAAGTVPFVGANSFTVRNIALARYTDLGTTATVAWTQTAAGAFDANAGPCVLASTRLYVGGTMGFPFTFGSLTFPIVATQPHNSFVFAAVDLSTTLAAAPTTAAPTLAVYPNPTSGATHLTGAPAHTAGQVMDALGRQVATFRTDATGAALLPTGLAPGVYAVRVDAATGRLVVQ